MAELDRIDREYGLGASPVIAYNSRPPKRRARSKGSVLPLVLTAVLLVGFIAFSPSENSVGLRRLLGFDNDRLAAVPQVQEGVGSYSFMQTQRGSDKPVAYDPCRPIEVAVNPQGAPDNYDQLVDTGLARTAAASGLEFTRVGLTDDRDRPANSFTRRQPVLIAWATEDEFPELAGDVAGIGGSIAIGQPGNMRYVTGKVILDRDTYASFGRRDTAVAQAIVDHELGHLVGLGHVDDPGELMHESALERTTYGPGDVEGLALLGSVDC